MFDQRHALSFGCSGLAGLNGPVSAEAAYEVLDAAWQRGVRYFDTAPHYGNGMSEHRLGDFLRERDGWLLSSKVGRVTTPLASPPPVINGFHSALPFDQHFDFSYDGVMRSVEQSYQRLGLNRIDILYVHDIGDAGAGTDSPVHFAQLLEGGAKALSRLKAEGSIRAIGLGVNTVSACEKLVGKLELDTILLAGRYTILDRSAETSLLGLCQTHNISLVIGGVFNSGILATGTVEGAQFDYAVATPDVRARVKQLEVVCQRHDVPLGTAALHFPRRNPLVASTLIGTGKVRSLQRNIEAWRADVPDALWSEVNGLELIR